MRVIEHEILKTMRRFGGTVTQTGTEKNGYTPLDHFELPTARYHYGTLCALLNHPENYKPTDNPTNYQTLSLKRDDILTDVFDWGEYQKAIEILRLHRHIKEEFNKGTWVHMEERIVCMTAKGLLALNTDWYLKQAIEDNYKKRLPRFTKATIWFTALAAAGALSAAILTFYQINKPIQPTIIPELAPILKELRKEPQDTHRIKKGLEPPRNIQK